LRGHSNLPASRNTDCEIDSNIKELDLAGAIDIALCNNTDTKIAWFNAKASASNLGKSRSEYLPTIKANASIQKLNTLNNNNSIADPHYNTYGPGATLTWLLYDFGGRDARIESAKQQMIAAGFNYSSAMQNMLLQVVKNYVNVLITEESVKASKKAEESARKIFEAAKIKLSVGTVTPTDKAQSKSAYSQSTLNRQNAENALQIAKGNFAAILHLSPTKKIQLKQINYNQTAKTLSKEIKDLINRAIEARPDISAARAQEKLAASNLKQAKAANYPSISGSAAASKTFYGESPLHARIDNSFGLQLSIPLFTGFSNHYQIQSAENSYQAAQTQRLKAEDNAALDVWTTYNNYQTATIAFETAKSLAESAEMSEQLTFGRYKAGKGNLLDALSAQATSANARYTLVQAKSNLLITKFDLDRALGLIDNNDVREVANTKTINDSNQSQ
jgi:TolC family type I secretion outer membrane protein